MAKLKAHSSRVYVDQHYLSCSLTSFGLEVTQVLPVVTTFCDTGPRRIVDNYDHSHSHAGLFEPEEDGYDQIVDALRTGTDADHYLLRVPGVMSAGSVGYEAIAKLSSKPMAGQLGAALALGFDMAGSGGLARINVLSAAEETVTGTQDGTGQNLGATVSDQRLGVWFRVISGTFTSITLKIQESQDDGSGDSYADISGLTSGSMAAAGVVHVSTTAATEAWKRLVVSAFSGTDCTILVTIGVIQ